MTTSALRVLAVVTALPLCLAFACQGAQEDAAAQGEAKAAEAGDGAAAAATPTAEGEAANGEGAAAGAEAAAEAGAERPPPLSEVVPKTGVAECDDYIDTMSACFEGDGIDPALRDAQRSAFEQTAKGWAEMVETSPDAKTSLASGCKTALEMARNSYPKCFD